MLTPDLVQSALPDGFTATSNGDVIEVHNNNSVVAARINPPSERERKTCVEFTSGRFAKQLASCLDPDIGLLVDILGNLATTV